VLPLDAEGDGTITDAQIEDQIAVLNADYTGIFQFNLVGNDTTTNQEWFEQASSYDDGKAAQSVRVSDMTSSTTLSII
jgi:hypothetical protein